MLTGRVQRQQPPPEKAHGTSGKTQNGGNTSALSANPDMPDDIRRDYEKASAILELSPRQKLRKDLGQPGEHINMDISALVAGGLYARLQQALDAVRVKGSNAVHPGQFEIR
ncbi:hypothetical protein [Pseudomonas fluorescens]|uniref:Uncharacterized protein n=1 Tax=Pseudomonas fluorescens TaxID=294 RepID=A0A5E7HF27_PSEFL|nr:hypothetical protein [Pseudomonas fluorescens]VVO62801.1 hypothetical protein PS880_00890 [Pseudomonas fluorescens]